MVGDDDDGYVSVGLEINGLKCCGCCCFRCLKCLVFLGGACDVQGAARLGDDCDAKLLDEHVIVVGAGATDDAAVVVLAFGHALGAEKVDL